jgi:hypothetical protein
MQLRDLLFAETMHRSRELNSVLNGIVLVCLVATAPAVLTVINLIWGFGFSQEQIMFYAPIVATFLVFACMLWNKYDILLAAVITGVSVVGGYYLDWCFGVFYPTKLAVVLTCVLLNIRLYSEGPVDYRLPTTK